MQSHPPGGRTSFQCFAIALGKNDDGEGRRWLPFCRAVSVSHRRVDEQKDLSLPTPSSRVHWRRFPGSARIVVRYTGPQTYRNFAPSRDSDANDRALPGRRDH
jgi:hypothetical protein